jgi:hypothetical protein
MTPALRWLALIAAMATSLGAAAPAFAQSYDGDWKGLLKAPGGELHLVLHVKTAAGKSEAVIDSPDQGASIPADAVKVEDGKITVAFLSIMGELKGSLSPDGKTLNATWSQGMDLPLTLTRVEAGK